MSQRLSMVRPVLVEQETVSPLPLQTFPALWAGATAYSGSLSAPVRENPNLAGDQVRQSVSLIKTQQCRTAAR